MQRSAISMALVLVGLVWLAGCGGDRPPVGGTVSLDGNPTEWMGTVHFHPESSPTTKGPEGPLTGSSYSVANAGGGGVRPGKYKVTITVDSATDPEVKVPMPDAKYKDASQTPLTVEVVSEPAPGAYDLKLTSK